MSEPGEENADHPITDKQPNRYDLSLRRAVRSALLNRTKPENNPPKSG